ncbi:hypothetical protein [Halosimplex salinum]|uniref:hypothetical protein n=1 Tax=Halosimplex salinum TaxID=1710538 RepID=UPI0019D0A938|nr:hypothetical protein [Halosimplex salinum]
MEADAEVEVEVEADAEAEAEARPVWQFMPLLGEVLPVMSDPLQPRILDELLRRGRYLYPTDVVDVIERFHGVEGPGVPRPVIRRYVAELLYRLGSRAPYTVERFEQILDGRVTDLDLWLPDALYEVGPSRVSVYPARWHRTLGGVRDPVRYVEVIAADLAAARGATPDDPSPPAPRRILIDAMMVLGGTSRPAAGGLLQRARLDGRLVVEPFQNPEADVWVADAVSRRPAPADSTASARSTGTAGPTERPAERDAGRP